MGAGFISISRNTFNGVDYWAAAWWKTRPRLEGVEYADRVLVETVSRAAVSREACLAVAMKKAPGAMLVERAESTRIQPTERS